jgi:hypothetical protein
MCTKHKAITELEKNIFLWKQTKNIVYSLNILFRFLVHKMQESVLFSRNKKKIYKIVCRVAVTFFALVALGSHNKYRQARSKERNLFKTKSRQLDEEALIEIERHRSIQDTRKFYKRLNDVKRPFEAQVAMCRAKCAFTQSPTSHFLHIVLHTDQHSGALLFRNNH